MPPKTVFSSFLDRIASWRPVLIAAAACCLLVTLALAAKPVPPPPPINVTSILHDRDTSGSPLAFAGDDLNGTQASYTNTGNVTSRVGNPGGWGLNLYNQVPRMVCLTLSRVDGAAPGVPNGCYSANVEIYSHCHDLSGNEIGFLTIQVGAPQGNCTFGFDFNTGGRNKYKWEMGQSLQSSPAGGPTGLATVTCNASNGSTCDSWTITPNAGALNPTVANLYFFGHHGLEYLGQYYLTYRIDVTNP